MRWGKFGLAIVATALAAGHGYAQTVPSPSQVAPPAISTAPSGTRIVLPQVPAGATVPAAARRLSFVLLGVDVEGEFEELIEARREIFAPLIGKRVTVADIFDAADKLQQVYVREGYPLVRVVIQPQELGGQARVSLRVVDGFIERLDTDSLAANVRSRVAAVLSPLVRKTHLKQEQLERQLLIAGDTAGLILNAVFAAGKEIGGSVLVLTGRYRPLGASAYFDNAMPQVFGTGQAVVTTTFNSLLGQGEQLSLSAAGLPDSDIVTMHPTRRYLSASALVPIGIDGWKLEIGATDGKTTPRVNAIVASQGLLSQAHARLSYDLIKRRDAELTWNVRFDSTDEEVDSLVFQPRLPLSLDRIRALRTGFEGIWRGRETGTVISFATNYSRGLNVLGARMAADADPLLPLSRQGADAVFNKLDGHIEVNQSLPEDFVLSLFANGQTSFGSALLTSEQFDITGAKMLSGYTAGALPGDASWSVRGELGRSFVLPNTPGWVVMPYGFGATGERILERPTVLEIGSVHATNYGAGIRFTGPAPADGLPDATGFIEWSRRRTTNPALDGDRIYTGMLLRY